MAAQKKTIQKPETLSDYRLQQVETKVDNLDKKVDAVSDNLDKKIDNVANAITALAYPSVKDFDDLSLRVSNQEKITRNTPLVERIVFGLVGVILLTVIGALLALVVIKGGSPG